MLERHFSIELLYNKHSIIFTTAKENAYKANTFKDNKLPKGDSRLWWSLIDPIVNGKGRYDHGITNTTIE